MPKIATARKMTTVKTGRRMQKFQIIGFAYSFRFFVSRSRRSRTHPVSCFHTLRRKRESKEGSL
jgi:hypothetical protein